MVSELPVFPLTMSLSSQQSQLSGPSNLAWCLFIPKSTLRKWQALGRDKKAAAQTSTPFARSLHNPFSSRYPDVDLSIYQRLTAPDNTRPHSL